MNHMSLSFRVETEREASMCGLLVMEVDIMTHVLLTDM